MGATPKTSMTRAEYEAQLIQASLAALKRSRELLAKTITYAIVLA